MHCTNGDVFPVLCQPMPASYSSAVDSRRHARELLLMADTLMSADADVPISAAAAAVYDDTAVAPERDGHRGAHLPGESGVRGD
jgi:hypothetical protein